MINTFLQIGKTLRENASRNIAFLPFVEIGQVNEIVDKKGKVKQEKPFIQIYDVFIDKENWKIQKSNEPFNENNAVIFIKGDNNDRFYIAGDINGNYVGQKDVKLVEYFQKLDTEMMESGLNAFILKFRDSLRPHIKEIENQIKTFKSEYKHKLIFIQFRFHEKGKILYWKDFPDYIAAIGEFIINSQYTKVKGNSISIKKIPLSFFNVYNLNNLQYLNEINAYKALSFQEDENSSLNKVKDLIVANKYINSSTKYFGKACVQVLPVGNYSFKSLVKFLKINSALEKTTDKIEDMPSDISDPFEVFDRDRNISKFDILFLNQGEQTTDTTLYISSINISEIDLIRDSFEKAKLHCQEYIEHNLFTKVTSENLRSILIEEIEELNPFKATERLLRSFGKKDKKLEKHHTEILFKIFRRSYYDDPILLKSFNEKVEYELRNNNNSNLTYLISLIDFIFINFILIKKEYMSMKETQSYKAGSLLGLLAKNLDAEISSFSKQYAGNISRRVATKEDLIKLLNFINEKLVIHDKLFPNVRATSTELVNLLNSFHEQYKKDYVVAGFFESYLMPFAKKED